MSSRSPEVVVAGAGTMAEEHVRALLAHGLERERVLIAARRVDRAEALAARLGVRAGSLESATAPLAIVAVAEDALAAVAAGLLERGAQRVLVEKPGALAAESLRALRGEIFVAYNRRFYPSVERARALAEGDGGVLAVTFDFTEIEERVLETAAARGLDEGTLRSWGIANSLHVIDLAFHLAGDVRELHAERAGTLPWHPAGATFAGAGVTATGALFSYAATWGGAGRWSVELTTPERRLVLRPLESLQQQLRGSFALEPVELPPEPEGVKPGLAGQLDAFVGGNRGRLCTAAEAARRIDLAQTIFGYG